MRCLLFYVGRQVSYEIIHDKNFRSPKIALHVFAPTQGTGTCVLPYDTWVALSLACYPDTLAKITSYLLQEFICLVPCIVVPVTHVLAHPPYYWNTCWGVCLFKVFMLAFSEADNVRRRQAQYLKSDCVRRSVHVQGPSGIHIIAQSDGIERELVKQTWQSELLQDPAIFALSRFFDPWSHSNFHIGPFQFSAYQQDQASRITGHERKAG